MGFFDEEEDVVVGVDLVQLADVELVLVLF